MVAVTPALLICVSNTNSWAAQHLRHCVDFARIRKICDADPPLSLTREVVPKVTLCSEACQ